MEILNGSFHENFYDYLLLSKAGQYCNLMLDISHRKYYHITIYHSFYKYLWINCNDLGLENMRILFPVVAIT